MNQELIKIKEELKAEILQEINDKNYHNPQKTNSAFNEVRRKYMGVNGPLYNTFGTVRYAKVWDHIRALATFVAGVRYVREFTPTREALASEVAEFLCEYAIQKKKGWEDEPDKPPDKPPKTGKYEDIYL